LPIRDITLDRVVKTSIDNKTEFCRDIPVKGLKMFDFLIFEDVGKVAGNYKSLLHKQSLDGAWTNEKWRC
jgi:hypothetical protein